MTAISPCTFKPQLTILPPAQKRLWPELRTTAALGFCLYGGTAIALRLGHRTSVDFDFFSKRPLHRKTLNDNFAFLDQSEVLQDQPNTLSVAVPCGDANQDNVKLSFFGDIDFGRVGEPDQTEDGVLQVASLDDLMATKLKVMLQRVEAKDYRDVAAMVAANMSLASGLAAARALYGIAFQPSESLKALVYFEGGDLHTLTKAEKVTLIEAASQVRDIPNTRIRSHSLVALP